MEEIKKAEDSYKRGEYHTSKDYAEKGLGIFREIGDRNGEAQACYVLAQLHYIIKDYEHSKEYSEQFQNIAKEVGDKKLEAEAYQLLAYYFYSVGDYKNSIENGSKSLSIAEEIGNEELKTRAHDVLAKSHQMARDRTEYGNQSPNIVIGLGDRELEGEACLKAPSRLRGAATRDISLGILEEELDVPVNHVVEVGTEEQKRRAPEVLTQSYYAKQGEYRALGARPQKVQEWSSYDDDYDYESSSKPYEQPLSTASEFEAVGPGYHPGTEFLYSMTALPRGRTLIVNNRSFASGRWETRLGSEEDVRKVKALFTALGFKVETVEDLSRIQLLNKVDGICEEDHSAYDCFVLWLMSHGKSGVLVCSDGETLPIQSIRDLLASCRTLSGKPKLIFIQACRGELEDVGVPFHANNVLSQTDVDSPIGIERQPEARGPTYADFLTAFSTVDDHVSYRGDVLGSYYVRCLVEEFRKRVSYNHLLDILTIVNNRVSKMEAPRQSTNENEYRFGKQMPEVIHSLRKQVRF